MSQLAQILRDKAEEIRLSSPTAVAVEHLKQAGFSQADAQAQVDQHVMEKIATEELISNGVDVEQAVALVKAAGVNLKDLVSYEFKSEEEHPSIELLKQAAEYIEALEAQISEQKEEIEKAASARDIQEVELPEPIANAARSGAFTNEDLAELQRIEPGVLNKLASAMDDQPWSMGSGSGMARPKTDPMLEFILS